MYSFRAALILLVGLVEPGGAVARRRPGLRGTPAPRQQLKVFLDCESCFAISSALRSRSSITDDRTEADVHLMIREAQTASGGREFTLELTGLQQFQDISHTLKTVTTNSDTDDTIAVNWRRRCGSGCCAC